MGEMASYVGAIDQGTTSTRFIVYDSSAKVVASHQLEFTQIYPQAGWVNFPPRLFFPFFFSSSSSSNICLTIHAMNVSRRSDGSVSWKWVWCLACMCIRELSSRMYILPGSETNGVIRNWGWPCMAPHLAPCRSFFKNSPKGSIIASSIHSGFPCSGSVNFPPPFPPFLFLQCVFEHTCDECVENYWWVWSAVNGFGLSHVCGLESRAPVYLARFWNPRGYTKLGVDCLYGSPLGVPPAYPSLEFRKREHHCFLNSLCFREAVMLSTSWILVFNP